MKVKMNRKNKKNKKKKIHKMSLNKSLKEKSRPKESKSNRTISS